MNLLDRIRNRAEPAKVLPTKTITLAGREVSICGSPSDRYFEHAQGHMLDNVFLQQVVSERLGRDATIFDIGANIGLTTTLFALHATEGKITSFEPSPSTFGFLNGTVAANGFKNVTPVNAAIGATNGVLPFMDNPVSTTASHLSLDGDLDQASHTVNVHRLDDIVSQYAPTKLDFIKIDVEGHEKCVFDGALNTLKEKKPLVYVEFNSYTLVAIGNENPRAFAEYLQSMFSDIQFWDVEQVKHVNTKYELLHFLHTNMISHNCVSDLLCIP